MNSTSGRGGELARDARTAPRSPAGVSTAVGSSRISTSARAVQRAQDLHPLLVADRQRRRLARAGRSRSPCAAPELGHELLGRGVVVAAAPARLAPDRRGSPPRSASGTGGSAGGPCRSRRVGVLDRRDPLRAGRRLELAGVGAGDAGQAAHQRRLAGAVLADDGVHLAALDAQADAVERVDPPVALADAAELDGPPCVTARPSPDANRKRLELLELLLHRLRQLRRSLQLLGGSVRNSGPTPVPRRPGPTSPPLKASLPDVADGRPDGQIGALDDPRGPVRPGLEGPSSTSTPLVKKSGRSPAASKNNVGVARRGDRGDVAGALGVLGERGSRSSPGRCRGCPSPGARASGSIP